jgi:hypothetical protein
MSCVRCQRVLVVEVTVDDTPYDSEDDAITVEIADNAGVIMAVCNECLTNRELIHKTMQSLATLLELGEEHLANMNMVFERIPEMRDNPEAKAQYAQVQARVEEARKHLAMFSKLEQELED